MGKRRRFRKRRNCRFPQSKESTCVKAVLAPTNLKSPKLLPLTQDQPKPSQFARSSRLDPKRLQCRTRKSQPDAQSFLDDLTRQTGLQLFVLHADATAST